MSKVIYHLTYNNVKYKKFSHFNYFGQNRFIPTSFIIVGTVQTLPNIFNTPSACGGVAA